MGRWKSDAFKKSYKVIFCGIYLLTLFLAVFSCCRLQRQDNFWKPWCVFLIHWFTLKTTVVLVHVFTFICQNEISTRVLGRVSALHGLWRFHCPHLCRHYMWNDGFSWYSEFNEPVMCFMFTYIAILLHHVFYIAFTNRAQHIFHFG